MTFSYSLFPQNVTVTAKETVTDNGRQEASKTFTFTPPAQHLTETDTIPITGKNGDTLVAKTVYTSSAGGATITSTPYTLTGCPVTYTGDSYNLGASASLAGVVVLSPLTINQIGPVSTMSASNQSNTILSESLPALGLTGAQLVSSVVTGSDVSAASSSTNGLSVLGLPLSAPAVTTGEVDSSSTTTCDASTDKLTPAPVGTTDIASLTIGSTVVVGPGGLVPSGPIPANTKLSLGPLGSVILNEQIPFADGLNVNAIDIKLTPLALASVSVIIGHSESDIEGC